MGISPELLNEAKIADPLVEKPSTSGKSRKTLILDDDTDVRLVLKQVLLDKFEVVGVGDGVEGLDSILSNNFDVIVCDMHMPTLPGEMFYKTATLMRPQLRERFIFITGCAINSRVREFLATVEGPVLMKPFQPDELVDLTAFVELRVLGG